jgi:NADH dehydrogenase
MAKRPHVVIIGAGFAGLDCAKRLEGEPVGVPGADRYGFPLYSLDDAIRLRNHILGQFEAADADPALLAEGALTFVVVGGGPTGVETAGSLTELFSMVLARDFRRLDLSQARVVLLEMGDTLLAPFSGRAQRHALEQLGARGVELRLGERVTEVTATGVRLSTGEVIPTRTLVWAAGVRANPLADVLGLEQGGGGRIVVGPDLRVPGRPEVSVVGDLAAIAGPRGALLPQLAPVAKQSGRFVGARLARTLRGRPARRFSYVDRGTMATIGRGSAVADLPLGIHVTGMPAWLAWLFLHLLLLAGFRNRLSVFLSWAWNYVTYDRGPRLIIEPDPDGVRPPVGT